MFELIFAAALVAAVLVVIDRDGKRSAQTVTAMQERHDASTLELIQRLSMAEVDHRAELADLFAAHRAEVQVLCQRIQAPEQATVEHTQANAQDEATYPLTDQETVEASDEKARFIAEIERMEASGLLS